MTFLKTERALLRSLAPEDARRIHEYRNDPECARFQRWDDTSMQAVEALIDRHAHDVFLSDASEQRYAIAAHDGSLLGELAYFVTPEDNCITLGVTIAPQQQGRGLAREVLGEVTARIRASHPGMDIVALIDPRNERSIRLFERLGFEKECYAESIDSLVYAIAGDRETNT